MSITLGTPRKRKPISVYEDTADRLKKISATYPSIDAYLRAVLDREERRQLCEQARLAMTSRTKAEIEEDHREGALYEAAQAEVEID